MTGHPIVLWTSCAAHCVDFKLEDVGRSGWVKEVVDVTTYIV